MIFIKNHISIYNLSSVKPESSKNMTYKTLEIINSIKKKFDDFRQLKPLEYNEIIKEYSVIIEEEFLKNPIIDIYLKEPEACVSFTMKEYDGYKCILHITENNVKPAAIPKLFKFEIPIIDSNYELQETENHYIPEILYRKDELIKNSFDVLIQFGILEYSNMTFKFLCVEGKPKLAV